VTPIVLLAAAPAVTVPAPPSPQQFPGLFSGNDYPATAMRAGQEGSVFIGALVGPDGRVDTCRVIISSGYPILDAATCMLVKTRARYSPATTSDGKAMYSVDKRGVSWSLGRKLPPIDPELEVTINRGPAGIKMPATVKVSYLSKADGKVSDCGPYRGQYQDSTQAPQVLVDVACQAVAQQPREIVRTATGQAVEASNTMTVRIRVQR